MTETLFDVPMILPETANTRLTDPLSSHVAGDKAQKTRAIVRDAVLILIREYGPQTGNDLNHLYDRFRSYHGWPRVSWDSPRKRAGELARDELLIVTNPDDPRGTPHIYTLGGA